MEDAEQESKYAGAQYGLNAGLELALPCPNGCASNLYYNGYYVVCQICGLHGPEQSVGGANEATALWNAMTRSNPTTPLKARER